MPIDASIPLSVQAPQAGINPLQSIGQLMQLRDMAAQAQQRQYAAEHQRQLALQEQAVTEQKNRDLADQNTIGQALKDPTLAPKLWTGDTSGVPGIQPKTAMGWKENVEKLITQHTTNAIQQNSLASENLGKINKAIDGLKLMAETDPEAAKAAYPSALQNLRSQGAFEALPAGQVPETLDDPKQLDQLSASVGGYKELIDTALARQKEKQGIAETTAKGNQAQAAADLSNFKLKVAQDAMSGGGGIANPEAAVATLIDPKDPAYAHALAAGKLAMQGADPTVIGSRAKAFNEAVEKVYEAEVQAPKKAAAVAAAELPAQINRAVSVAKATAPIEQARAITTANTNRANAGAEKLDTEYNNAKSTTEALGRILDLADKGNKAAGSNVPLVGVETLNAINGIKRVNSAEINQYGNAGSLLDKIKGKLGGLVEGKPIPQDVLDDIRELHGELGAEAYNKYTTGLKSLEQRTPGVKLPPTIPPPHIREVGAASASIPTPTSQAEYNALPKGAQFKKPNDPKVYIKH